MLDWQERDTDVDRDWQELHRRSREHVGERTVQDLGTMSAAHFHRFAVASDDPNPRYADDEAAREQGFPAAVAPPLLLSAMMEWGAGPAEKNLRSDGTGKEELASLPLAGLRLMGAGQDLEFFEPVLSGTRVTVEVSLDDVELKQSRSGPMLVFRLLRRYRDGQGTELMRCHDTFFAR